MSPNGLKQRNKIYTTASPEETMELGQKWGREAAGDRVFCLFGTLGAGKTTLIKGIVGGVLGLPPQEVASPTFVYLNIYGTPPQAVYHFDLYRLKDEKDFLAMGFEEYLENGVTCIEWSEKIASLLPTQAISIFLAHAGDGRREISIRGV